MSLLYEAENLKKRYGGELALDIPHFSLEQGASLALAGANGSGKSTFLRLLAFLEEPSEGRLRYFGGARPRRECTLLLQDPWLLRASVRANVLLGLRLRGRRKGGDCGLPLDEAYRKAMLAVGFEEPDRHAKRRPGALSGGERQRVALAARLILSPRALLLDEPTAHVDAASAGCIIRALRDAHAKGAAVVCATHDDALAAALQAPVMKMRKPV